MVDGSFQDVMTLPAALIPTPGQRIAIENHVAHLRKLDSETPHKSNDAAKMTFVYISDMMKVLASQVMDERGAEATADAYMTALDDVPFWATNAAITRWYRGQCGKDERGDSHQYKWRPDPATLRRIAVMEQLRVVAPVPALENILKAVPYIDNDAELERGALAMKGLHLTIASEKPDGEKRKLTFDEAVELGRKHYGDDIEKEKPDGDKA